MSMALVGSRLFRNGSLSSSLLRNGPISLTSCHRTGIRSISSTPRTLDMHKFIVYAPDKTDEGAFERRLAVRPKHLEVSNKMHEAGTLRKLLSAYPFTSSTYCSCFLTGLGGAMLTPESIQLGSEKKMVGSVLIFEAETLEAVRKVVERDIYYTSGVVCLPKPLIVIS